MEKFSEKLEALKNKAIHIIFELIQENGIEGEHTSNSCLKIENDDLMLFLEGDRYLTEVHENNLRDNEGYEYSFDFLETEQFFQVIDYLISEYS